MKPTILIIDDEKSIRDSMLMLLKGKYQVLSARHGKEALKIVRTKPVDLVFLDIRLPEIDGLEILKQIKTIDENIEVVMLTAVVTVKSAVKAMKIGAYDYISKPFDMEAIFEVAKKALEKKALQEENRLLRELIEQDYQFEKIVGKSLEIRKIFDLIDDVAKSSSTVLISGESGTGKELVARAIHRRSKRSDKLFIAVNCAAIPENLLESELFGHEKGSFTGAYDRQTGKFEMANGGTLFLDEIGSLPLPMQAKLLRVLQSREIERIGNPKPLKIDVRIISATNSDLKNEVENKKFREDLFYRLNVVPINIPPLRERKEDIPLLINHFLHKYNHEFGKKIKGFNPEALLAMTGYDWPGNVRELENIVERLMVLAKRDHISLENLPAEMTGQDKMQIEEEAQTSLRKATQRFEAAFIKQALEKAQGNKSKAAKFLGVHRNTLLQIEKRQKN